MNAGDVNTRKSPDGMADMNMNINMTMTGTGNMTGNMTRNMTMTGNMTITMPENIAGIDDAIHRLRSFPKDYGDDHVKKNAYRRLFRRRNASCDY